MFRLVSLFLSVVVGIPSAYAAFAVTKDDLIIKVRQIDIGRQVLSAEIPPAVKIRAGDYLVAQANGVTCNLRVQKVVHIKKTYRHLAMASLTGCQIANRITRGQRLVKSDFSALAQAKVKKKKTTAGKATANTPIATPIATPVATTNIVEVSPAVTKPEIATINGFQFSVFFPYADNLRDVGVSNGGTVTTGDISTSLTGGLNVKYNYTATSKLGFNVGMSYDFERKFDRALIKDIDGVYYPIQTFTHDEGLSIISPEANLTYGFTDKLYSFAGLNYSFPILSNAYATDASGDVGVQVGAGFIVGKNFTVEASYRLSQVQLSYRNVPDTTKAIGKLHNIVLSTSYFFDMF